MIMLRTFVSVFFLLTFATACPAYGGVNSVSTLRGRIVGPDNAVIIGAKVKLTNPITSHAIETTTDEQGGFAFYNLSHDSFVLAIEAFRRLAGRTSFLRAPLR